MQMQDPHHELSDPDQQIIETLIDEHIHVSYNVVPIDDETWAIHASIAVDGEVIVAEFHDRADAETALSSSLRPSTEPPTQRRRHPTHSRAPQEDASS